MKPSSHPWARLVLFFFTAVLLGTGQAHAKRGFKLITTGTSISDLGAVKPEFLDEVKVPSGPTLGHIGFKYDYFGLFWLDLWNWDGAYCVFNGDDYAPVEKQEAARLAGMEESKLGKPLNYRFPLGLDILLALGLLKFVPRLIASRKQKAGGLSGGAGSIPPWTPPAAQVPPAVPQTDPGAAPPVPPPLPPEQG